MRLDPREFIPHREPFLLLDEITELTDSRVIARARPRLDDELWSRVYAGHYPGRPLTPGVLLCEMIFQAAAALAGRLAAEPAVSGTPMVARVRDAKFRLPVFPGEDLEVRVDLEERLANAFFMRGEARKAGKLAAETRFAVALV